MLLDENLSLRNFGDWRQSILELADSLRAIDIDLSAFACLAALTLITGNAILLVCMGLSEKKELALWFFRVTFTALGKG